MPRTAVVTDSTACLPTEMAAGNSIEVVSLYVSFGGDRTERESDLMADLDTFYDEIRSAEQWPTTSQPSVGDFLAAYEPLIERGDDVVSIHLSGGISGTVRSAEQARDALVERGLDPGRIVVLDSRTGCAGHGLMAVAADNAAKGGASAQAAADAAAALGERMTILFAVDTLEYLRRGGRIGAAQAFLGSALQIKPILTLEEEITPVERVRTRRRAFERMVEFAHERKEAGADAWVVQHIHDAATARKLVAECRQVFGSDPVFVSEIGPVIGAHIGPGLLGFGGMPAKYLG